MSPTRRRWRRKRKSCGQIRWVFWWYIVYIIDIGNPSRNRKSQTFFLFLVKPQSSHQKGGMCFFFLTEIRRNSHHFVAGFRRGQRWAKSELFCRRTWEDGRYETTCLTGQSQGLWIPGRTQVEGHNWGGSLVSVVLTHSFFFQKMRHPFAWDVTKK